jgi:hypothetical protein
MCKPFHAHARRGPWSQSLGLRLGRAVRRSPKGRFQGVRAILPSHDNAALPTIQALLGRLEQKYDIVHLLCDVTANGTITDASGKEITGTELIQRCCDQKVKLLWCGSDNLPDRYIKGFGARGKRLNLVMTLRRKGPTFPGFLQKLMSRMAYGDTMPVAWNDLCPPIPGLDHPDARSLFSLQGVAA